MKTQYRGSFEYDINHSEAGREIQTVFDIEGELYRSDFSIIFKIKKNKTNEIYVLKAIRKKQGVTFEIEAIIRIDNLWINKVHEVYESEQFIYLIEDFVYGKNLQQYIEHNGPLNDEDATRLILMICESLKVLHNHEITHFVFRDLKPSNIMLMPDGNIVLIDVISIRSVKENRTQDTFIIGSKGYTAPEAYGFMQTSIQSDIYSLGATLYYLLTGKQPANIIHVSKDFDEIMLMKSFWKAIILKATEFHPKDRFQDIDAFSKAVVERKVEHDNSNLDITSKDDNINTRLKRLEKGITFKLFENNDLLITLDRKQFEHPLSEFKFINCGTSIVPFTKEIVEDNVYNYSFIENNGFEAYDDNGYIENLRDRNRLFFSLYNSNGKPLAYYLNNDIREGLQIYKTDKETVN